MFGFTSLLRKHTTDRTASTLATRYAGAYAFAVLTYLGLVALYVVLDLAAISASTVHVFGTFFVLACAGLGAWMFHGVWND